MPANRTIEGLSFSRCVVLENLLRQGVAHRPAMEIHRGCVFCGKYTLASQYGSSILVAQDDFWVNRLDGTLHGELSSCTGASLVRRPGVFLTVSINMAKLIMLSGPDLTM